MPHVDMAQFSSLTYTKEWTMIKLIIVMHAYAHYQKAAQTEHVHGVLWRNVMSSLTIILFIRRTSKLLAVRVRKLGHSCCYVRQSILKHNYMAIIMSFHIRIFFCPVLYCTVEPPLSGRLGPRGCP